MEIIEPNEQERMCCKLVMEARLAMVYATGQEPRKAYVSVEFIKNTRYGPIGLMIYGIPVEVDVELRGWSCYVKSQ